MVLKSTIQKGVQRKVCLLTLYCYVTQFSSFPLLPVSYDSSSDIPYIYEYWCVLLK